MVVESKTMAVLTVHADIVDCSVRLRKAEMSSIRGSMRVLLTPSRSLIQPPLQGLHTVRTFSSRPTSRFRFLPMKPAMFVGCILPRIHSGQRCSRVTGLPPQNMHVRTGHQPIEHCHSGKPGGKSGDRDKSLQVT